MLTLHPQSAMEHLHHRFVAADGSGSDGAIAFEATEVSSTARGRTLVPVRPAAPLAGAPDRSPIPLADNVQAAGVAVSAAAGNARTGRRRRRGAGRRPGPGPHAAAQAGLPADHAAGIAPRDPAPGRPGGPRPGRRRRRPRPRRLRVRGQRLAARRRSARSTPASRRSTPHARTWPRSPDPGSTSSPTTPSRRSQLLTDAYRQLDAAEAANVAATVVAPLREQTIAGLDRLYGVVPVSSDHAVHVRPGRRRRPDRPARDGPRAGRRARTSSIGPRAPSTASTSRRRKATVVARVGPEGRAAATVANAALPGGGRPGPADPRRQERPVALAAGRHRGQGHADPGQGQGSTVVGRRHHGHQHVPARRSRAASTTCTSSTRPSSRSGPTRRPPTAAGSRPPPRPGSRRPATSRR